MTEETAPFFELRLDGAEPKRFRTPQDAMTAAEDHPHPTGEIVYYAPGSTQAVPVILYREGRIETAPSLGADDDEDDPWVGVRSHLCCASLAIVSKQSPVPGKPRS